MNSIKFDPAKSWAPIAKAAAWAMAIVTVFLAPPPGLWEGAGSPSPFVYFAQFIVAVGIALYGFSPKPWSQRRIVWVAAALTVVGGASFFAYQALLPQWTCQTELYGLKVIGAPSDLSANARAIMGEQKQIDCESLLEEFKGRTQFVWINEAQLLHRYLALAALFTLATFILSSALMLAVDLISVRRRSQASEQPNAP